MRHRRRSRHRGRRLLLASSAALVLACGGGAELTAPATGSLQVTTSTTGAAPDPDGYRLTLDDVDVQAIGVAAAATLTELTPGAHRIGLTGISPNCAIQGDNPRGVTVVAGETASEAIAVVCQEPAPVAGTLEVITTSTGAPEDPSGYTVSLDGAAAVAIGVNASRSFGGLSAGAHTVELGGVADNCAVQGPNPRGATVAAAQTATVGFAVACSPMEPPPALNLRIAGLYFVQSVQSFDNQVPLVAGRDAFLRVFAQADQSNTLAPSVRVRLYRDDVLVETFTIAAPADTVPTGRTDGDLGTTWNVLVPGSLIQPGLEALADVDPDGAVSETDESDNAFPAGGGRRPVSVRPTPPLAITLVPVRQSANQLQGDVTAGNGDQYLDLTRRIYPLPGYDAEVHAVYTTDTESPLLPDDANGAWNAILTELAALQLVEDSDRTYYGVVRTGYASGLAGRGFLGLPIAIGYDQPGDRARVTAHELGHTWNRLHAPCGDPPGADPNYPYPEGNIDRFGFDPETLLLKQRDTPDIMGYCGDPWISDYTYEGVMEFRGTASSQASARRARPVLLLWGRMVNGRAVLEPGFRIVARPVLPSRPGPYSIEGLARDGSRVLELSFDAVQVADDARDARHFAFAVPFDEEMAARLESLRLSGPGVGSAAITRVPPALRAAPAEPVALARVAEGLALRWDVVAHPMVLVRDARTGEVLSFARGGSALLPANGRDVELLLSDGVGSRPATAR